MLLGFGPEICGVSSRPFWLHWRGEDWASRRHAPDLSARRDEGTGVVVDVRPDDRIPARDAEAFAVTASACDLAGWEYRRAGEPDPVLAVNVRWLSRCRRRRCLVPEIAGVLREVFAGGRGLFAGAELAGERIGVLPVLFGLMWRGQLTADLAAGPLSASAVGAVRRSAVSALGRRAGIGDRVRVDGARPS